jgi:hypothetical protein
MISVSLAWGSQKASHGFRVETGMVRPRAVVDRLSGSDRGRGRQAFGKLLRIPVESDGAFETVLPDASWNDVTAYRARAYYTEHGAVRSAR